MLLTVLSSADLESLVGEVLARLAGAGTMGERGGVPCLSSMSLLLRGVSGICNGVVEGVSRSLFCFLSNLSIKKNIRFYIIVGVFLNIFFVLTF